ncbi:methylenetetrahydrofolate reductase [Candidatus Vidania fulgoroideorum]
MISFEIFPSIISSKLEFFIKKIFFFYIIDLVTITFSFKNNKSYKDTFYFSVKLKKLGFLIAPHFPCVKSTIYFVIRTVNMYLNNNIYTLLLLRGDIYDVFEFKKSYFLIKFLNYFKLKIIIPGFPEGNFFYKKKEFFKKLKLGINLVISQFTFDFKKMIVFNKKLDITNGIIISKKKKIKSLFKNCGVNVPNVINYSIYLRKNLNIKNIHIFTMNNFKKTLKFLNFKQ